MNKKIIKLSHLFCVYNPDIHYCQKSIDNQHWVIYENNANPRIVWGYHHYNE